MCLSALGSITEDNSQDNSGDSLVVTKILGLPPSKKVPALLKAARPERLVLALFVYIHTLYCFDCSAPVYKHRGTTDRNCLVVTKLSKISRVAKQDILETEFPKPTRPRSGVSGKSGSGISGGAECGIGSGATRPSTTRRRRIRKTNLIDSVIRIEDSDMLNKGAMTLG